MEIDELLDDEWVEENNLYLDDGEGYDDTPLIPNSFLRGMGQFILIYDL